MCSSLCCRILCTVNVQFMMCTSVNVKSPSPTTMMLIGLLGLHHCPCLDNEVGGNREQKELQGTKGTCKNTGNQRKPEDLS